MAKYKQALVLILVLSAILIVSVASNVVKAQENATVTVITTVGGSVTLDPAGGSYADGTTVTLTANPGNGFIFTMWEIVTAAGATTDSNNPTTITVSGGTTYAVQADFSPLQTAIAGGTITNYATAAIVVVLPAVGGTTSPAAGYYALANASSLQLSATPMSGFKFDHWVIGGSPLSHGAYSFTDTPTDNPYTVDHGYGYTYTYQPVFSSTTVPEFSAGATAVLAIVLVASLISVGTYAYTKKRQ